MCSRRTMRLLGFTGLIVAFPFPLIAQVASKPAASALPAAVAHQDSTGFRTETGSETVQVMVCSETVIHVVAYPTVAPAQGASPQQPWMLDRSKACPGAKFTFAQNDDGASLATAQVDVRMQASGGSLIFSTADGAELLRESQKIPRTYDPVELNGVHAFHAEDRFSPGMTEGLYGLGQHQNGMFNYRGSTIELGQNVNTDVAIPLLISTRGYGLAFGIPWRSLTYFDDRYAAGVQFRSSTASQCDRLLLPFTGLRCRQHHP